MKEIPELSSCQLSDAVLKLYRALQPVNISSGVGSYYSVPSIASPFFLDFFDRFSFLLAFHYYLRSLLLSSFPILPIRSHYSSDEIPLVLRDSSYSSLSKSG